MWLSYLKSLTSAYLSRGEKLLLSAFALGLVIVLVSHQHATPGVHTALKSPKRLPAAWTTFYRTAH
jgi:hypothetical protein